MVEIFNEFGEIGAPSIYQITMEWFDANQNLSVNL